MREQVFLIQNMVLVIPNSQVTLLDENIGKVNILIEVVNDHIDKVLSFNQIPSKVLPGSLSSWIAALVHLLDQFQSNFEILQWVLLV